MGNHLVGLFCDICMVDKMTTLQESAIRNAIKLLEELRGISYLKYEHTAIENSAKELRAALAQQVEPVCAGCGIPAGDVHMSTCKSGKWPSRVSNGDTAAPAPQAQECKPLCELCVKRGYAFCANVAQTTPITVQSAHGIREVK